MSELYEVRAKWYGLGVQLGMKTSDLDAFETQYQNNLDRCLIKMLSDWLSRTDPSPPSWQRVVDALSSPAIGNQVTVGRLQQIYCKTPTINTPGMFLLSICEAFI